MARICEYRHCNVDLDAVEKRPQAKYCGSPHKAAEHRLREAEEQQRTEEAAKPYGTVSRDHRRRVRRKSGTNVYVLGDELRFLRGLVRGGSRPNLPAQRRRNLRGKLDRAMERLAV